MSAKPKPLRKTYPAKPRASTRKVPLPAMLEVVVTCHAGTFNAQANRKAAASTTSAANAVRRLAEKLGYNAHADIRYVTTADAGWWLFEIMAVQS